jgi:hypothetical protein
MVVGESISRVRNVLKAVKEDPFMTDRFLYSLIMKFAKTLIKREELANTIYKYTSVFKEIPCLELIDVDRVEECCAGIKTGCTIKRSKNKLPELMELGTGPVIRAVTTLDYSKKADQTYPTVYANMTKTSGFKYNKGFYYWFLDGYLYIPNVDWEAVRFQAIFDEDISSELCSVDGKADECVIEQERVLSVPEHLFSEIEQLVIQQVLTTGQIPSDGADDSQNTMR